MFAVTVALAVSLAPAQTPTEKAFKESEKAFKEWGDSLAGSAWTGTDARGDKYDQRFEWVLNKSFLKATWNITGDAGEGLAGIDPATGKVAFWSFDDKGRVSGFLDVTIRETTTGRESRGTLATPIITPSIKAAVRISHSSTCREFLRWIIRVPDRFAKNRQRG